MSLRDEILAASDLQREKVDIPEWGMALYVRVMSGTDIDAYRKLVADGSKGSVAAARLVAMCAVDEAGNQVFALDDSAALSQKSWLALNRLAEVAARINMLTDKSVENAKGNSVPSPGDAQSSASP